MHFFGIWKDVALTELSLLRRLLSSNSNQYFIIKFWWNLLKLFLLRRIIWLLIESNRFLFTDQVDSRKENHPASNYMLMSINLPKGGHSGFSRHSFVSYQNPSGTLVGQLVSPKKNPLATN